MAQYELVTTAANVASKHVFRARFNTNPCSDIPQLQAWDDYNLNSVASQILAGFTANANEPLVAAASTDAAATGAAWAPGSAVAGGALVNRLRGEESYVLLGAAAPGVGDDRLFNLIMGCHADSAIGVSGNTPAFAVKAFYAAAPPDIEFYYNRGADDLAGGVGTDWILMTSQDKGVSMSIGVKNAIFAADVSGASPAASLAPVTKPGSGEKFAPEHWVQTAL
jgi:hypothetical protein